MGRAGRYLFQSLLSQKCFSSSFTYFNLVIFLFMSATVHIVTGLRVGYSVCDKSIAAVMMSAKQPYNINCCAGEWERIFELQFWKKERGKTILSKQGGWVQIIVCRRNGRHRCLWQLRIHPPVHPPSPHLWADTTPLPSLTNPMAHPLSFTG